MKPPAMRHSLGRVVAAIRRSPLLVPGGRARRVSLMLSGVVFAGAATQVGIAWATALPNDAVLRADDTIVTEEEFQQRVDVLDALYGVKQPAGGPKLERFKKDAAKSIAVSLILDRAAQERGIVIADKQAQDALNKLIEEQLTGGRDTFVQFLGSQGISERDVVDEVKRQLATGRLFEQVTADVKAVTDQEARQAYQDRKEQMVRPEKRHLRNIVVKSNKKAEDILNQARSGVDFAGLAKNHSLDRSTKNSGGDLGTVSADQLDEQYADAAFKAEKGSFFGPVKTQHGWNVGQVLKIVPAEQLSFGEVKKQLKAELNNKRKFGTWRSWLANQIAAADVEYADEYRPDNPDLPPTDVLSR